MNKKNLAIITLIISITVVFGAISIAWYKAQFPQLPNEIKQLALNSVKNETNDDYSVMNFRVNSNCAVVEVYSSTAKPASVFVSLEKESSRWKVRRTGNDFDLDAIAGPTVCP